MKYNIKKIDNNYNDNIEISINNYIEGYLIKPKNDQIIGDFHITDIKENLNGNYVIPNSICYRKKLYRTCFSYSRNVIFLNHKKINNITIDNVESITNSLFIYNKCLYSQEDFSVKLLVLFDSYKKSYLELHPNIKRIEYAFCPINNSIKCLITNNKLWIQDNNNITLLNKFNKLNKIIIGNKTIYKKNNKWKLEQNLF